MSEKKLLNWSVLLFLAWSVGWFSHQQWNKKHDIATYAGLPLQQQPASLNETESSVTFNKEDMRQSYPLVVMNQLLEKNDFQNAFEHFDVLQEKANDTIVQQARNIIFSRALHLINAADYRLAKQLLNRYLLSSFRDIESRLLLAKIDLIEKRGRNEFS